MTDLPYKGYHGTVEVDLDAGILHGYVLGISDTITFEARSVEEIGQAFRDSVDDYLECCGERGKEPARPYSGRFVVWTTPERHRAYTEAALASGQRLNDWVDATLTDVSERTLRLREAANPVPPPSDPPKRRNGAAKPNRSRVTSERAAVTLPEDR